MFLATLGTFPGTGNKVVAWAFPRDHMGVIGTVVMYCPRAALKTKRYLFQDGESIKGKRGAECGWLAHPEDNCALYPFHFLMMPVACKGLQGVCEA